MDNIKGLRGVGGKTASLLLLRRGSLLDLLEEPSRAGRFEQAMRDHRERLLRYLELATIRMDLALGFDGFPVDRFRPGVIQGAGEFYRRLGMRRRSVSPSSTAAPP